MSLWCRSTRVTTDMQKVCQQPNYQPNRLATLQTGQVTTSVLTKGDVTELEKNLTLLSHLGWEFPWKSYHLYAVFFSHLYLLCVSQYFSVFSCTMWWKSLHVIRPFPMVRCYWCLVQREGRFQIWNWSKDTRCCDWPLHSGRCNSFIF